MSALVSKHHLDVGTLLILLSIVATMTERAFVSSIFFFRRGLRRCSPKCCNVRGTGLDGAAAARDVHEMCGQQQRPRRACTIKVEAGRRCQMDAGKTGLPDLLERGTEERNFLAGDCMPHISEAGLRAAAQQQL